MNIALSLEEVGPMFTEPDGGEIFRHLLSVIAIVAGVALVLVTLYIFAISRIQGTEVIHSKALRKYSLFFSLFTWASLTVYSFFNFLLIDSIWKWLSGIIVLLIVTLVYNKVAKKIKLLPLPPGVAKRKLILLGLSLPLYLIIGYLTLFFLNTFGLL